MSLQRPDPAYQTMPPARLTQSIPVTRSEKSALARSSATGQWAAPAPAAKAAPPRLPTDNISHWTAPSTVVARGPDLSKFNALSLSEPWVPHTSNEAGARAAVYDPIAHTTTVFTFDGRNGVSRTEVRASGLHGGKAAIGGRRDVTTRPLRGVPVGAGAGATVPCCHAATAMSDPPRSPPLPWA